MAQYEELKQLIADNKAYTKQVNDDIAGRLGKAEAAIATLAAAAPAPRNYPRTKEYTVKPGDSLTKIAKAELGNAGLFTKIATMNYDRYPSLKINANAIQVGWKLRLPA